MLSYETLRATICRPGQFYTVFQTPQGRYHQTQTSLSHWSFHVDLNVNKYFKYFFQHVKVTSIG